MVERPERSERSERFERADRPERSERGDRGGDRGDRGDRGGDRGDRGDRFERRERTPMTAKARLRAKFRKKARKKSKGMFNRRKVCRFCADSKIVIDYKDTKAIRFFVTETGKMIPSRVSGNCAKHQRELSVAIKRARHLALMPFVAQG